MGTTTKNNINPTPLSTNSHYALITGANGEVGHGLVQRLANSYKLIALDVNNLDPALKNKVDVFVKGSVTDKDLLSDIFSKHKIDTIYHLAAVLSTSGEKNPELAHEVNVGGTYNLLSMANRTASKEKRVIKFIFPSTIAVYGMKNKKQKAINKKPKEEEFLNPITIYGINKLYCENLGVYFSTYYMLLSSYYRGIDFRCLRFPGLISADTIPSGGTSDYAPEMLHTAAKGERYECFVRPDSIIHFMAMPDAIDAMLKLANAPKNKLMQRVYNIRGFSASAEEIEAIVKKHFHDTKITYKVNTERQRIVDSWSEDIDDSPAVRDWGWKANYDFKKAFEEYLIPSITKKYE